MCDLVVLKEIYGHLVFWDCMSPERLLPWQGPQSQRTPSDLETVHGFRAGLETRPCCRLE